MLRLFFRWFKTSDPSKKFRAELDLMYWGAKNSRLVRKYFQRRLFYIYNCEISHNAQIHPSVLFGHPTGVVIGSNVVVGADCRIYQQVTLGANLTSNNEMPSIGKGSIVGAGAKIIGPVTIGEHCLIGANAVVTKNVPSYSVVGGTNKYLGPRK